MKRQGSIAACSRVPLGSGSRQLLLGRCRQVFGNRQSVFSSNVLIDTVIEPFTFICAYDHSLGRKTIYPLKCL